MVCWLSAPCTDRFGGGGIMGNLLGRALGGIISQVGQQMQEAGQAGQEVRAKAAAMIEGSGQVRRRLGGSVRVEGPVSQSIMTSSINGRASRRVTLVLPVVGVSGRVAQAQVNRSYLVFGAGGW